MTTALDENVSQRLVEALRDHGHGATSANLLKHKGLRDAMLLWHASRSDRVMVTHNISDFRLLHQAWQAWSHAWHVTASAGHAGILLINPGKGTDMPRVGEAIHGLATGAILLTNRLFT